ncbi:PREDICTED: uncharacterized protein LOC104798720 isoform X2 [Tarenaya hassleriana]|uniref:uncharacterized protein LOC104798720 isoform X2 n=1 Tax=Tarenaya hassleriana TaxID=28532 RepID=UPI00053C45FF|nr:PREDICTED: uncharacterized protein LOC104798720 isoform X2 [Tarenaya hassleriana]
MSKRVVEEEGNNPQQQKQETRKQVRQPPSVPFLWEQRPGLPKPDWKPIPAPPPPPLPPPVKLVASVPFAWEETPGKPFPCFEDDLFSGEEFLSLPPPPMYAKHDMVEESDETGSDTSGDNNGVSSDSFSSAPSLLASNCLVSSCAVPADEIDDGLKGETTSFPTSPAYESDESICSYKTSTSSSSLVGASFLEKLFPLLPPDSGLVRNVQADSQDVSVASRALAEAKPRSSDTDRGHPVRKPATLGELIMMSRRRSYMRRAVETRKKNPPMEFPKNEAEGCCLFVPGIKMMEGIEWKKIQPRLKLL